MKCVELEIYRENGLIGLTISRIENGNGEGYRIFGPKMAGQGKAIETVALSVDEIDRLIEELNKSKKFLKSKNREIK